MPFHRRTAADFNAEVDAHIALEADRLRREGMSEADALAAAHRRFGNDIMTKERFYERAEQPWLEHLAQDLRYAARLLLRNPAFTIAAVLTLALGIGANTAIFTAVDALALHPLRFPEPSRLMSIETRKAQQPEVEPWTSRLDFEDIRQRSQSFSAVAGISPVWNMVMTGRGDTERLEALFVSSTFFPLLGVKPMIGRDFAPTDDRQGAPPVALLSYDFWQSRFGGSAAVLDQKVTLDNHIFTIVGVLPAGFHYPGDPVTGRDSNIQVWAPMSANPLYVSVRSLRFLKVVGRLKPGVTLMQASSEVRGLGNSLATQFADTNKGYEVTARSLEEQVTGQIRSMSYLMLGAVGLVLAMACTCVANLLLIRATARRREIFMRVALGASRVRLLVQLLVEGLLLASIGGVAGVALAWGGLKLLLAAAPATLVQSRGIALDGRALLFTATVVLLSAIFASLPPAWRMLQPMSRPEIGAGLRQASQNLAGGHHRLRSLLVAAQVAFALTLLVGAGLLLRSFGRLLQVRPGFDTSHVASIATQVPRSAQTPAQRTAIYRLTEERLRSVAGVQSVGAVSRLPLSGMNLGSWLWIEGRSNSSDSHPEVEYRVATPSYFSTMGIPLISGRLFEERDNDNATTVCVISETLARSFFPGQDPVGQRINFGAQPLTRPWVTILGVVGDVRHFGIEAAARPEIYRPYANNPLGSPNLVIRVAGDPAPLMPALAAAVRSVSPEMAAYNVFSMRELARRSTAQRRFVMTLLIVFALAALLLAAVGIYGVSSQIVAQRTREIGLRMALGATPAAALRMILSMGAKLAAAGIAAGAVTALGLSRWMRGLLYEVSPFDPLVFTLAALVLGAVAIASCLGPARRATQVAPMTALRDE